MNYLIHYKKISYLWLTLIIVLIATILLLASTPPVSRDALTHHLFVPKLWIKNASIAPLPEITFSFYPMNLDLLYTIPLYFKNDIIPKYIHFFFALLTSCFIYRYLKNRLEQSWALFGALFFLSLPVIIKLSFTVYVDLGVIAFTTASLLMLFKWAEFSKLKYLILAGVFCGLAAGTKYNGLISIFLLTLLTPIISIRLGNHLNSLTSLRAAGFGFLFLLITLLTYSPWMVQNYRLTGNPIYPLHNSLFTSFKNAGNSDAQSTYSEIKEIQNAGKKLISRGSSNLAQRKELYHETWWQSLLLPIRFFLEGQDDDPRYFDGKLNPFLFVLMFFAFYHYKYPLRVRKEQYFLLAFSWLFFFFTFFQEALRIRYIATALPAFVILATYGLHNISDKLKNSRQLTNTQVIAVMCFLCLMVLGYNFKYLAEKFHYYKPLEYITGKISRHEYISRYLPEYPIQLFASENLPPGSKILAIYVGRRGYYFDFPVTFDINGNTSKLGEIIKESNSKEEIYSRLRNEHFSHLFIRFDLFTEAANRNLTREKITLFNDFLDYNTIQMAANSRYGLFEIHNNQ